MFFFLCLLKINENELSWIGLNFYCFNVELYLYMYRLLKYLGGGGWGFWGLYMVIFYVNLINFLKGICVCYKLLKNKKV